MISSKYIDRIVAAVMALAMILTGVLWYLKSVGGDAGVTMLYEKTLFDKNGVAEIDIQVDTKEWQELLENAMEEEYISCDISINGQKCTNVGIRCKGNTSLSQVASSDSDRYSFKVKFDEYVTGQNFDGLNKLALNNTFCDATYMKEYLSYDLMNYLDMEVPLYAFAHITVNGEEWGLYLAVECVEESFAQRNYGNDYGTLYKVEGDEAGGGQPGEVQPPEGDQPEIGQQPAQGEQPKFAGRPPDGNGQFDSGEMPETGGLPGERQGEEGSGFFGGGFMESGSSGADLVYTDDDPDSYSGILENASYDVTDEQKSALIQAIKDLNEGTDLDSCLDLEQNLKYFAANTFLVNEDDYLSNFTHNIYLYEKEGQLSIIPWDYNLSFGGFQSTDAENAVNAPIDTPGGKTGYTDRPLLGKLLEQEEYTQQYHEYLQEIVSGYFLNGTFENTVNTLTKLIEDYVKEDATAFYSYEEFTEGVEMLKLFGKLRAYSVQGQLDGTIPSTAQGQKEDDRSLIPAQGLRMEAMGIQGGFR